MQVNSVYSSSSIQYKQREYENSQAQELLQQESNDQVERAVAEHQITSHQATEDNYNQDLENKNAQVKANKKEDYLDLDQLEKFLRPSGTNKLAADENIQKGMIVDMMV